MGRQLEKRTNTACVTSRIPGSTTKPSAKGPAIYLVSVTQVFLFLSAHLWVRTLKTKQCSWGRGGSRWGGVLKRKKPPSSRGGSAPARSTLPPPPTPTANPGAAGFYCIKEPVARENRASGGGPPISEARRHKGFRVSHRRPPPGPVPKLPEKSCRSTASSPTPRSGRFLTISR